MANSPPTSPTVRLAEVVASVALATDLATGQPLEHGLRRALLAVWLGEELGLDPFQLSNVYYVALLGTVGCTIEGAALAHYFKDEILLGEQIPLQDPTRRLKFAAFFLGNAGAGEPPLRRVEKIVALARAGTSEPQTICRDVALQIGDFLHLGSAIREALGQCHEHWNGTGGPQRLQGEAISLPARLFILSHDAEIFHRIGGTDAVEAVLRQRAGTLYDPRLATRFAEMARSLFTRLQSDTAWDAVLTAEPAPVQFLSPPEFDHLAQTIANFVDARSVYTLGHSPQVAFLAEVTVRNLGLSVGESTAVRHAGLLHDLGRLGVPVALWDKRDPLSAPEWERMIHHPALTELLLARSHALGHLGMLAGLHHERLDGSGYRSVPASFLPLAARVLAVADTYRTKQESRPHRPALAAEEAAEALRSQVAAGQFDREVVDTVLQAAGHPPPTRKREWPVQLTDREIDVLRLAVRGLSNREMAEALVVSPKTVGHHIQHIYDKIGVSTRVGATLFALQHGLVD
jgi:HD-GYP domain-containing protein (c-di-GMP phosphodiesterase class II)